MIRHDRLVGDRSSDVTASGRHAQCELVIAFIATASRTVDVPVERLFDAFASLAVRERWMPGAEMRVRTETPPRTARYDWGDGSTRVVVGFLEAGPDRSRVAISHERLPDADARDAMKEWWQERLGALKELLET